MDSKAHVVLRTAAALTGGVIGSRWQSQLAEVDEKLVNAQFSHKQESEADEYSFDLMHQHGINPNGLATRVEKLAKK